MYITKLSSSKNDFPDAFPDILFVIENGNYDREKLLLLG